VEYAVFVVGALADHPIIVFYLAPINVVDRFATVLLTDSFRRAVVGNDLLDGRTHLANGQRRFVLIASYDNALPARVSRDRFRTGFSTVVGFLTFVTPLLHPKALNYIEQDQSLSLILLGSFSFRQSWIGRRKSSRSVKKCQSAARS
jgi:hypothetical protein